GCPNKGCTLTKDVAVPLTPECAAVSASGANGECWRTTIPINAASGEQQITVGWNETTGTVNGKDCTKGQGCNGTFTNSSDNTTVMQQAYIGNSNPSITKADSGPLQLVEILGCSGSPPSCASAYANSLPIGNNTIAVTIGIQGALRNAQTNADN